MIPHHVKDDPFLNALLKALFVPDEAQSGIAAVNAHVGEQTLKEQRKDAKATLINLRQMFALKLLALGSISAADALPHHPFGCLADLKSDIEAVEAHIQDLDARIAAS